MRSSVVSSGRGAASSTVLISSSSNTNRPGAIATQRPALTHTSLSIVTSYPTKEAA